MSSREKIVFYPKNGSTGFCLDKLKIVEKVQPQRDIWEKSIKEWNTKNSSEETKSNDDSIELNINEMML